MPHRYITQCIIAALCFLNLSAFGQPSCTEQAAAYSDPAEFHTAFCQCYINETVQVCHWNNGLHHVGFPFTSCDPAGSSHHPVAHQMIHQALSEIKSIFQGDVSWFCANPITVKMTPCEHNQGNTGKQRCHVNDVDYSDVHPHCAEDTQTLIAANGCVDLP